MKIPQGGAKKHLKGALRQVSNKGINMKGEEEEMGGKRPARGRHYGQAGPTRAWP